MSIGSIDLTEAHSAMLDADRQLLHGDVRLFFLKLNSVAGFDLSNEIHCGWMISDDSEGDGESSGQLKIEICQSDTLTEAILTDQQAGFLYVAGNDTEGQIMKIVDYKRPLDRALKLWTYNVTPENNRMSL